MGGVSSFLGQGEERTGNKNGDVRSNFFHAVVFLVFLIVVLLADFVVLILVLAPFWASSYQFYLFIYFFELQNLQ